MLYIDYSVQQLYRIKLSDSNPLLSSSTSSKDLHKFTHIYLISIEISNESINQHLYLYMTTTTIQNVIIIDGRAVPFFHAIQLRIQLRIRTRRKREEHIFLFFVFCSSLHVKNELKLNPPTVSGRYQSTPIGQTVFIFYNSNAYAAFN